MSCLTVFQVPLENASRLVAVGAEANTDAVFSPDEKRLAIGTHLGEVLVVDAFMEMFWQEKPSLKEWSNGCAGLQMAKPFMRLNSLQMVLCCFGSN